MSGREEFSVWVFMPDGHHFAVAQWIDAATAVRFAMRIVKADEAGIVKQAQEAEIIDAPADRVIITDGGDFTCFEWVRGQGVTFPPEATGSPQQPPRIA